MSDRLPLAPGSRWDGAKIIDAEGFEVLFSSSTVIRTIASVVTLVDMHRGTSLGVSLSGYTEDLRAILHANGYLTEVDELAKLREKSREMVRTVYGFDRGLVSASTVSEVAQELESLLPK
jgi:hypothetical protein